ncbi:MBL fold metallo-hydrolase [Halobacteria archaeon AArc-curdl1]|uniref:MBL fold metallo-hydrolase n=1 Tax=Natronosalvus hydrolyticus TaxID=2979988 RepID=A0AAP2Z6T1_9EURY|nr:MBL fold metallo-hydrolase [Halobacteria archaeon AArc-curdl1]
MLEVTRVPLSVPGPVPTGRTNAYIIGDDPAVLVDPATRDSRLENALSNRTVEHIFVTHCHPDHVGGVATYAETFGATVWARAGRESPFTEATGIEPDKRFAPGETISLEGGTFECIDAPGHTPGHVVFALRGVAGSSAPPAAILVGDCAIADGSVAVTAPEGDMRAYLSTLRRLRTHDAQRLYPGHGPAIEAPREALERLLAHRLERERRVLAAVDDGAASPEAIVDVAYEKDVSHVFDLARATVVAHLEKLAVEGALTWDGTRATV